LTEKPSRGQKVGRVWSEDAARRARGRAEPRVDWSTSPAIQKIINRRVSGSPDIDWLEWLLQKYVPSTLSLGFSIGCGSGVLERDAISRGICQRMVGCDIAEGAIEKAKENAGDLAITYELFDLESGALPSESYDVAFASATLHHVNRLGHCAEELHGALKQSGLLVVSEFVGPARFQWTPEQLRIVTDIYSLLPWRYRFNYQSGGTVAHVMRPHLCSMVKDDPSEAVRSADIESALEPYFELLESRPIGGTILNPLLGGIMENFDEESEVDLAFLNAVAALEDALMEKCALESDFKIMVYRRRECSSPSEAYLEAEQARGDRISEQERRIERLLEETGLLSVENEKIEAELARVRGFAGEAGQAVARAVAENARLKSGVVFRVIRALRGSEAAPPPTGPPDAEGGVEELQVDNRRDVPAPFGEGSFLASDLARAALRYVAEAPGGNDEDMTRSLAALEVYADAVLASKGIVPAARSIRDIAVLQDMEIDRLTRGITALREYSQSLSREIGSVYAQMDGARLDRERLAAEREVLRKRGPLMYWRLFKLKANSSHLS